jgi:hypothetical protein
VWLAQAEALAGETIRHLQQLEADSAELSVN